MRGSATLISSEHNLDLNLGLLHPNFARVEIVGPLGIRLAMLNIDNQWVQFFVPREKTVFRIPTEQFLRNTARRKNFLRDIRIPIDPKLFIHAALNRVQMENMTLKACVYDEAQNFYLLRWVDKKNKNDGVLMEVDPTRFTPLKLELYSGGVPGLNRIKAARPIATLRYSELAGKGLATLAKEIDFQGSGEHYRFEWNQAERWVEAQPSDFSWRPSASTKLKEY